MTKGIFGILVSVLLIAGFYLNLGEEQQKLRSEAATRDMQSYTLSEYSASVNITQEEDRGRQSFDRTSDSKISDAMLGFSHLRNVTAPSKTLRHHFIAIKQMHVLSNVQLPANKWQGLSPDTNYIKYSDRYYVYTLGHLLI